ncbi:MAG: hypothetical protein AAF699_12745 [Pseudomonadota bacterium]
MTNPYRMILLMLFVLISPLAAAEIYNYTCPYGKTCDWDEGIAGEHTYTWKVACTGQYGDLAPASLTCKAEKKDNGVQCEPAGGTTQETACHCWNMVVWANKAHISADCQGIGAKKKR